MSTEKIAEQVLADERAKVIVFDACSDTDILLARAVTRVLEVVHSKHLLFHSGTSFTACLAGNPDLSGLSDGDFVNEFPEASKPGLILAGSMTPITTEQVRQASIVPNVGVQNIDSTVIKNVANRTKNLRGLSSSVETNLNANKHSILITEKSVLDGGYPDRAFRDRILEFFSDLLLEMGNNCTEPAWYLFKGSDTAISCLVNGLEVDQLEIVGPLAFAKGCFASRVNIPDHPLNNKLVILCAGNSGNTDSLVEIVDLANRFGTSAEERIAIPRT